MKRLISLFLFVASLAFATIACRSSPTPTPTPTEAPTEAPTDQPTEVVTEVLTATPAEEATPSLGDTWTRPADGMVMVYVPAGEFKMGSIGGDDDEQPVHTVALDGFWIDRTEVTKAQYEQCVAAGACTPCYGDSPYDDYPAIYVTWYQAGTYCGWAGGRLPTEAEWEYAARGPEARVFPWGDEFDGTRLNFCDANCERD